MDQNKETNHPSVSDKAIERFKKKRRKLPSVDVFFKGIRNADIPLLGQAITLTESTLVEHQQISQSIIEKCLPYSGNSFRIGITGVPGVGKSTFIEYFGKYLTTKGHKIAVLTIDPSSERTKGSILGDKTRMEKLSGDPNAFIRPSPSAGSLGGVANKTREALILCEAAGFDTIIIETVGVGQSETAVHSMVDFFLLLMLAGAGDELQGIKRGIMEMADAIAITKADGNNIAKANIAKTEYTNALHLFPPTQSGWIPQVTTCSAAEQKGVENLWEIIHTYFTKHSEYIKSNRRMQAEYWMHENIEENLKNNFYQNKTIQNHLTTIKNDVLQGKITSFSAAKYLLNEYFKSESD